MSFLQELKRLIDTLGCLIWEVGSLSIFGFSCHPPGFIKLPPPLIIFRLFSWARKFFSQVYFEEITLCFTLINVLKVLHLFETVALLVLLHDIYNYNSEQFVVKASKLLCNFILYQQFSKHFSIYISVVDEFFI